jgi:hypothetical protein
MRRATRAILLALMLLGLAAPTGAQQSEEEAVPPATGPVPLSAALRNAGYTLTAEEAAYLDADEGVTEQFLTPLLTIELHAPYVQDEYSRQIVLAELRRLAALDPTATPVAPPPTLAELHRLALARRTSLQEAARQWLEGLEANDPAWVARGAEAYGRARQAEADWYALLRQRLSASSPGAP